MALAMVCLFLANDISFASGSLTSQLGKSTLAPPLATKPIDESTGILEHNKWIVDFIGRIIYPLLKQAKESKLKDPVGILIPLVQRDLQKISGVSEIFKIEAMKAVYYDENIIGISLPVRRDGLATHKLIYNLRGEGEAIEIEGGAKVWVAVDVLTTPAAPVLSQLELPPNVVKNKNLIWEEADLSRQIPAGSAISETSGFQEHLVCSGPIFYQGKKHWVKFSYDLDEQNRIIIPQAEIMAYLKTKNTSGLCLAEKFLELKDGIKLILFNELPQGHTLKNLAEKKDISEGRVLEIIIRLSEIVKHSLLDNGVYHWDIKSSNVWITDKGEVIIFDFDFAFFGDDIQRFKDRELDFSNTPRFTSPNRIDQALFGHSPENPFSPTDEVYSLAMTIVDMFAHAELYKEFPYDYYTFHWKNEMQLRHMKNMPDWVQKRKEIPVYLKPLLARALSKDVKEQYKTIEEFISDLYKIKSLREKPEKSLLEKAVPKAPVASPAKNIRQALSRAWKWLITPSDLFTPLTREVLGSEPKHLRVPNSTSVKPTTVLPQPGSPEEKPATQNAGPMMPISPDSRKSYHGMKPGPDYGEDTGGAPSKDKLARPITEPIRLSNGWRWLHWLMELEDENLKIQITKKGYKPAALFVGDEHQGVLQITAPSYAYLKDVVRAVAFNTSIPDFVREKFTARFAELLKNPPPVIILGKLAAGDLHNHVKNNVDMGRNYEELLAEFAAKTGQDMPKTPPKADVPKAVAAKSSLDKRKTNDMTDPAPDSNAAAKDARALDEKLRPSPVAAMPTTTTEKLSSETDPKTSQTNIATSSTYRYQEYISSVTREADVAWKIGMHGPTAGTLMALFNEIWKNVPCIITLSGIRKMDGEHFSQEYDTSKLIMPLDFMMLGVREDDKVKIEIESDIFVNAKIINEIADIIKECFEDAGVDVEDPKIRSEGVYTTLGRSIYYVGLVAELFPGDRQVRESLEEKFADVIKSKDAALEKPESGTISKSSSGLSPENSPVSTSSVAPAEKPATEIGADIVNRRMAPKVDAPTKVTQWIAKRMAAGDYMNMEDINKRCREDMFGHIRKFLYDTEIQFDRDPLHTRPIILIRVPKEVKCPIITEKDSETDEDVAITVWSYSSDDAIYVFTKEDHFEYLKSGVRSDLAYSHLELKLIREIGNVFGVHGWVSKICGCGNALSEMYELHWHSNLKIPLNRLWKVKGYPGLGGILTPAAPAASLSRLPEVGRQAVGQAAETAPKTSRIDRLAEYIKSTTGKEIVEIDASSPEQIVELLKKGDIVSVSFKNFKSQPDKYNSIRIALYGICCYMQNKFPHSPIVGDLNIIATEILKNAFVHGNKLNFEHPVFLHLKKAGGLNILEVFDVASTEKTDDNEMKEAGAAELHSSGVGEQQWLSSAPYKRQTIKDESGNVIGTVASLALNPSGWENPIEDYPDALIAHSSAPVKTEEIKTPTAMFPDSERIHADNFRDAIEYIQYQENTRAEKASEEPQPLIFALGTSWIKGYEKGEFHYNDLNPLITSIRNYCEARGISFIVDEDDKLSARIKSEKTAKGKANAKVIVLAGETEAKSDDFIELRNDKKNTFVVGVNNQDLTADSYAQLMEMLTFAMKLGTGMAVDLKSNSISITMDEKYNIYIFFPHAGPVDYNKERKHIYDIQRFA